MPGLRADFILETELRDFTRLRFAEQSAARDGRPHAQLIKIPERKIVAQQRVIRQQPAAGTTIPDIVNAFNAALSGRSRGRPVGDRHSRFVVVAPIGILTPFVHPE